MVALHMAVVAKCEWAIMKTCGSKPYDIVRITECSCSCSQERSKCARIGPTLRFQIHFLPYHEPMYGNHVTIGLRGGMLRLTLNGYSQVPGDLPIIPAFVRKKSSTQQREKARISEGVFTCEVEEDNTCEVRWRDHQVRFAYAPEPHWHFQYKEAEKGMFYGTSEVLSLGVRRKGTKPRSHQPCRCAYQLVTADSDWTHEVTPKDSGLVAGFFRRICLHRIAQHRIDEIRGSFITVDFCSAPRAAQKRSRKGSVKRLLLGDWKCPIIVKL